MKTVTAGFLVLIALTLSASGQQLLSRNISGFYWQGEARVESEYKKVTVNATHLIIEEEVEISATVGRRGNPPEATQNALEIFGTFTLPHNAVLTGAILWDGSSILKAKLKANNDAEAQYNEVVDHDWQWIPQPTDPVLISLNRRSTSGDIYDFQLFPVKWGNSRRMRIRYLVPMNYVNNIPMMKIPSVFVEAVNGTYDVTNRPESYILELIGGKDVSKVKIDDLNSTRSYYLSQQSLFLTKNYSDLNMRIELPTIDEDGYMHSSIIKEGVLEGEYLHYYSSIPEELLLDAGLKREVVFLWRWENEDSFVKWTDSYRYLSDHGNNALAQARKIKSIAYSLLNENSGVGLVLDRTNTKNDTTFDMAYKNSDEADSLLDFLDYITNNNGEALRTTISGYKEDSNYKHPLMAKREADSICKEGAEDFKIAITEVRTLFSPEDRIIKHVVVITAGHKKVSNNIIYTSNIENLEGVSMSFYGTDDQDPEGYWPGVDMKSIAQDKKLQTGTILSGYLIPKTKDINLNLYLRSSESQHILTAQNSGNNLVNTFNHIYFTGHTKGSWSDTVLWYAEDSEGNEVASYMQIPHSNKTVNDTDVVMLWGGSSSHPFSEVFRTGSIGYLVGFVDEEYSLLALPEDSMTSHDQEKVEQGGDIENLTRDDIFAPLEEVQDTSNAEEITPLATDITRVVNKGFHSVISLGGGIQFNLNIMQSQNATLTIYDMKGRVMMRFTHSDLIGKTHLFWNGRGLNGSRIGSGVYTAMLTMDNYKKSMRFTR